MTPRSLDSAVPTPSDRPFASVAARAWIAVGTLIAVSIGGRVWLGRGVPTPWISPDTVIYPLLALAAWTMANTIVEPTPRRQALLVGLVALAALTRLQAIVLVAAFPTAVLLSRSSLRRYAVVFCGFAALGGTWAVWRLVHGGGALGAYTVAASGGYHAGTAARFGLYHLGDLVLMTGFLPAAAAGLLWSGRPR